MKVDVCVVGAGPAGTSTALHLIREGLSVALLDRATFPRDKCCGDGLTSLALRELRRLDALPDHLSSWRTIERAEVVSPSGRRLGLDLRRQPPIAATARRMEFDSFLLERAEQAGAMVRTGSGISDIRVDDSSVRITSDDARVVVARHVVGADGARSTLRRLLTQNTEHRNQRHDLLAMRAYGTEQADVRSDVLRVWFPPDLIPGYVWSFPSGKREINFGIMVNRRHFGKTGQLRAVWDKLSAGSSAIPIDQVQNPKSWPIPSTLRLNRLSDSGALFVGDAAGLADPMTGEGIGQALVSGRYAAESIARSKPGQREGAAAEYRRRISRVLVAEHELSASLVRPLSHARLLDKGLQAVGVVPGAKSFFARWMFEDVRRTSAALPCRWTAAA
ncbi:NAD(P)/FAD-dependent oxidoreductase [Ilumatobacter coccineus]|uniref:Putative oxidoreductase n=1 Tax=Ilumatobacter coccineus (strain NBRC 103263 / KCTC 29153 / YM16-304) TaxID=1313172 RepID=A0A6C7E917_ILUCY|nr:geranylgeranyl reductase family protein [Ilumatobacter coccineus]BAN00536.1 putative oxidoreductase [Ilumatobacter coccineus YM16-304]